MHVSGSGTVWSWQRWFCVSTLTFLIICFGFPCMHTESGKKAARLKTPNCRGDGLPCAPLPPPFPEKLSVPPFEEERNEFFPFFTLPLPCLWIPQSQRRLVNRASRPGGETRCKALFKLRRESAADYAASTVGSGLNFSPFCAVRLEGCSWLLSIPLKMYLINVRSQH